MNPPSFSHLLHFDTRRVDDGQCRTLSCEIESCGRTTASPYAEVVPDIVDASTSCTADRQDGLHLDSRSYTHRDEKHED